MSGITDEQLAEIEAALSAPEPESCDCDWKEPHTNFDCDYEDRRETWLWARVDAAPLLLRALRDARAENQRLRFQVERRWAAVGCAACHARQCEGHLAPEGMTINGHALNAAWAALAAPTGQETSQ